MVRNQLPALAQEGAGQKASGRDHRASCFLEWLHARSYRKFTLQEGSQCFFFTSSLPALSPFSTSPECSQRGVSRHAWNSSPAPP